MSKPFFILVILSFLSLYSHAQVNIEQLRSKDMHLGLNQTIELSIESLNGNSDYFGIESSYRADYVSQNYSAFILSNYEQARSAGDAIEDKHFIHLRFMKDFSPQSKTEYFIQNSANQFTNLQNRFLIGTGIRHSLYEKAHSKLFDIGIGLMLEDDTLNTKVNENYIRSTNYIVFKNIFLTRGTVNLVAYYQPKLSNFSDFRALTELSLLIPLNTTIALKNAITYSYDSAPPDNISNYDLKIKQGLLLTF